MPKAKIPKPETPPAEMSTAEKIEAWRRKRAERGMIEKPKGKKESK